MSTAITKIPTREEIVARAKALAPKLRARSAEAEKLRRVPDETIADLKEFTARAHLPAVALRRVRP